MESPNRGGTKFAVIGGGFSGLAAAHRLHELRPNAQITLFESTDRIGGVVGTECASGYLVEHGADMFTTREPWALELCRRMGFDKELIPANTQHARAFVVHRGRMHAVPEGFTLMTPGRFWPIARSGLLSPMGKLRMAAEYFVPAIQSDVDESLEQFVTRRLGREAYERLVQPLIAGIYTADPTKLSMRAALPSFQEMERKHGGLIRALRRSGQVEKSSGARYGSFVAPRGGMESFARAIASRLPHGTIRLGTRIESVRYEPTVGWRVAMAGHNETENFDALILAAPARVCAELLDEAAKELAADLRSIPYASAAIVVLGFESAALKNLPEGFGIVVPLIEKRRFLAASIASAKFEGRAAAGHVLLRVFVGGACQPELVDLPDDALRELAIEELRPLIGIHGEPDLTRVVRWHRAMPQYHVGHVDRILRIEQQVAALPRFALAGNAYRGVGIPFCIRSGEQAAESVTRELRIEGTP